MHRSTRVMCFVGGLLIGLGGPTLLAAQACVGVPSQAGQFALGGGATFGDGWKGFSASGTGNLDGPLSLGGSYTLMTFDGLDENGHSFGGTVAYELQGIEFSACPVFGLSYGRLGITDPNSQDSFDLSVLTLPVGFGLGVVLPAGDDVTLTPFATPQLLITRTSATLSLTGIGSETESETDVEFGAVLGATLGIQQLLLSVGVVVDTVDETDAALSVGFGVVF